MIPRRYGRIINIASIAGLGGSADVKFIAYGTSKGAVVNFTRTLAGEWGAYGITVNALAPGFFPSKMTKGTLIAEFGDRQAGRAGAAEAHRRRRRPEGRGAAVRLGRRQAHHRADPGGGRRRQLRAWRRLIAAEAMQFARHIPFVHLLGAELLRFEEGESEIALEIRDELNNSWHVAHGGVVMTLLDVAMAHATRVPRKAEEGPDPRGVVTIEMKTTFMRPAQGRVTCIGKLLHRSAALAFCEGTVLNADGRAAGPCHRHLQVPVRTARGQPTHPVRPTLPTRRST